MTYALSSEVRCSNMNEKGELIGPRLAPSVFSPDLWKMLLKICGSPEEATRAVEGGIWWLLGDFARKVAPGDMTALNSGAFGDAERTRIIGYWVHALFRERLAAGEMIGWGRQPPSIDLVQVPKGIWSMLDLKLGSGMAQGGDYKFIDLHFSWGEFADEAVIIWLRDHEQPKKVLQELAIRNFPTLTVAKFNAAYRAAFGKSRGRPPNSANN